MSTDGLGISVTIGCATSDSPQLRAVLEQLDSEGLAPTLLAGLDNDVIGLGDAIDGRRGPGVFVLCQSHALSRRQVMRLQGMFSARRGPLHTLVVVNVDAARPLLMLRSIRGAVGKLATRSRGSSSDPQDDVHLRDIVGPTSVAVVDRPAQAQDGPAEREAKRAVLIGQKGGPRGKTEVVFMVPPSGVPQLPHKVGRARSRSLDNRDAGGADESEAQSGDASSAPVPIPSDVAEPSAGEPVAPAGSADSVGRGFNLSAEDPDALRTTMSGWLRPPVSTQGHADVTPTPFAVPPAVPPAVPQRPAVAPPAGPITWPSARVPEPLEDQAGGSAGQRSERGAEVESEPRVEGGAWPRPESVRSGEPASSDHSDSRPDAEGEGEGEGEGSHAGERREAGPGLWGRRVGRAAWGVASVMFAWGVWSWVTNPPRPDPVSVSARAALSRLAGISRGRTSEASGGGAASTTTPTDTPERVETESDELLRVREALKNGELRALDALLVVPASGREHMPWWHADDYCRNGTFAGLRGFRLPAATELGRLALAGFLGNGRYWSSTAGVAAFGRGAQVYDSWIKGLMVTPHDAIDVLTSCIRKR